MSLIGLQRRIQEAGRIRIGQQVTTRNGKRAPAKLSTFRLTSADKTRIDQAAGMYGGTPQQWHAPAGKQWEVVTETDAIDVIIPPSEMSFSQFYELWASGGCQRRCDGVFEQISEQPCETLCDPENRECKPHTRLSVMIRDLPGLGVWRIDTQGYYAAVELQGAVQVVEAAAGAGTLLPARLRLEQRQTKRPGQPTHRFAVPVIDIEVTPAQLLGGQFAGPTLGAGSPQGLAALPAAQPDQAADTPAPLTPVSAPPKPSTSIADQVAAQTPQNGGSGARIPATGLRPRTARDADAGASAPRDGAPEGVEPVGELELLTVAQLKMRLKKAGLPVSGTKDELIARLRDGNTSGSDDLPEDSKTGSKSSGGDGEAPPAQPGEATDSAPPQEPHDETEPVELPVSDAQRKKLFAVMREHDITDEQRKAVLQHGYDVDSLNDLTKGQVAKLIDGLESSDGATRFKALADGFLADEDDVVDAEIVDEADTPGQPSRSLAERAHAHAKGTSDSIGRYQTRIRRAFAVLAEHRPSPYEGGWDRLEKITDGRAAESDWSGSNESQLRALADDMERAAQEVEDNQ